MDFSSWVPPPPRGDLKVNCDAAVKDNEAVIACAIRNDSRVYWMVLVNEFLPDLLS